MIRSIQNALASLRKEGGKTFFSSFLMRWIFIVLLALVIAVLTTFSFQRLPTDLSEGMIASRDIKADRNYEIIDEEATRSYKEKALEDVLSVYDFDKGISANAVRKIKEAFEFFRGQVLEYSFAHFGYKNKAYRLTDQQSEELRAAFFDRLGVEVSPADWEIILEEQFSGKFEDNLVTLVQGALLKPIVPDEDFFKNEKDKGITLRTIEPVIVEKESAEETKNFNDAVVKNLKTFLTLDEAKEWISQQVISTYGLRDPKTPAVIMQLAKGFVQSNVSFDRYETEKRFSDAAKTIKDVVLKIKAGEIIVRHGSRYDAANIKLIKGIVKEKERTRDIYNFIGIFIIIFLLMIVPFYFARNFLPRFKPNSADYVLMAAVGLVMVIILRISLSLAPAITSVFFIPLPAEALNYAIPVAGGVILLKLLLPSSYALIFSIVVSAFAGLFVETNLHFAAYSSISNIAAMIMVGYVDRRSSIMKAGIYLGLVNAICVAGILLLGMGNIISPTGVGEVLIYIVCAFFGGIFSAIFAMIFTPLAEGLSGHISDIKLLELSNLNHPLLRELIIRAPGTYHHSHLVGILSEAAAEKIGANPLLVRVGAYYHDVGKMRKPQYFVENSTGENKHEKLSPSMSSLILLAHVKDGIEMAKEGGLPGVIIDMIPQHHGTRLMSFFYDKAKQSEEDGKHAIDKQDFRYPGPRPQSREAAILMLADSTEAAVRALKEKSSMRIQQTVQKTINDCFAESQLDECDLTLRDLNLIAGVFTHILLGIYHQRIEYPKDRAEDEKENGKSHTSEGKSEVKVVDKERMREVSTDNEMPSDRNKAG